MTTASVYYRDQGRTPDFVFIDGYHAKVTIDPGDALPGYIVRAVDKACRTLGWRAMDGAPIVRQADGRGTIRIEPIIKPGHDHPDDGGDYATCPGCSLKATQKRGYGAFAGHPNCEIHGDECAGDPTRQNADSDAPGEAITWAVNEAHAVAIRKTYPDANVKIMPKTVPVAPDEDWRDHPTIVRVSDNAAAVLNDLSAKLGIPADELATDWILRSGMSAQRHYDHDTAPGWVGGGNRIARFLSDGSAIIEPEHQP